jgi:hypothetical protein
MRAAILIATAALLACQQGDAEAPDDPPVTEEAAAVDPPVTEEAATVADPAARRMAEPAADSPAATGGQIAEQQRRRILGFCVFNLRRTLRCFDDDAYWDTFMTHFYATSGGGQADPEQKQRAIGILKDDILKLQREERFVENCENMISTHKLPTEEQMKKVEASYDKSCAEYASALGYMIFHQRVFHDPR